ncbi:MAG: hypothetical protein KY469_11230 [Actinobacteria bacterium]|nr:hypothetical protein [Actinomycetota bacterium]
MRRRRQRLSDATIGRLLAGGRPDDADLYELADFVSALHRAVAGTPQCPSDALSEIFSDGLDPVRPSYALTTADPSRTARGRRLVRTLATRFAAFGLFVKLGLGAAVAAAATTGAGAAGVLPAPVQDAVAGVVGTVTPFELPSSASDTAREAVERRGGPGSAGDEDRAPALEADLGQEVAEDATGQSDGEPGVEGREVADEASDGRSSDLPDRADEGRTTAETKRETAGDRPDDAPEGSGEGLTEPEDRAPDQADEHIPDDVPAGPQPGQAPAEPPGHGRG